jgi:hypothetical protein
LSAIAGIGVGLRQIKWRKACFAIISVFGEWRPLEAVTRAGDVATRYSSAPDRGARLLKRNTDEI